MTSHLRHLGGAPLPLSSLGAGGERQTRDVDASAQEGGRGGGPDDDGERPSQPLVNRAGQSNSPYVQAHADSPVRWQLLDDEAVARAKKENKLIFLNIGFRACHYCRLTTQDSFSHPSVAAILNRSFVPIIVDREERPDVDTIYMNYIQAVNWVGGWPINVFLTPELEPVFGGTYWPGPGVEQGGGEDGEEGRLDFLVILQKMETVWREQEARCRKEAGEILSQLREFAAEGTLGARGIGTPAAAAGGAGDDKGGAGPTGRDAAATPAPDPSRSATMTNLAASGSHAPGGGTAAPDPEPELELDLDQLEEAFAHIAPTFDAVHGGFGPAPKFPTPARLSFLLRLERFPSAVADVVGEKEVRNATLMALHTLRRLRDSALRDHVGGGFARYSVTDDWSMPHFEKTLADNALLLGVYLDAWLLGRWRRRGSEGERAASREEDEFAAVVFELADYLTSAPILRDDGGFASSEAADSFYRRGDRHMREGAYYLWTRREFDAVVGGSSTDPQQLASAVAAAHWNVLQHGNVPREQDPQDEFMNMNVLRVAKDEAELTRQFGIPADEVRRILAAARAKLRAHREQERVRPVTDRKVVASYNGMAIAALARTAAATRAVDAHRSARYLAAAVRAAEFLREKLWDARQKVLYRTFNEFRSETRGFADDYAFLIEGLLDLFEATGDPRWLEWAEELQGVQIDRFYDPPAAPEEPATPQPDRSSCGGFYSTEAGAPHTILRLKDGMDTAQPSTNGVSTSNLFRLGALLRDDKYAVLARETITAFEVEMLQYPWLFLTLLTGVVAARLGARSWAVVTGRGGRAEADSAQEKDKESSGSSEDDAAGRAADPEAAAMQPFHTAPRAEARGVAWLRKPSASDDSWLLRRNGDLRRLVDEDPTRTGVFEWTEGSYRAATGSDIVSPGTAS